MRKRLHILLVALLGGCSLVFTKGPPASQPSDDCTESNAVPVLDTVTAAALTLVAAAAIAYGAGGDPCERSSGGGWNLRFDYRSEVLTTGLVSAAIATSSWISAGIGYSRTSSCRATKHEGRPVANNVSWLPAAGGR